MGWICRIPIIVISNLEASLFRSSHLGIMTAIRPDVILVCHEESIYITVYNLFIKTGASVCRPFSRV